MDWARWFLLPASTCAQVAAVVEKRLWPAHSCVSFNGAVLMPVLLSADAAGIFPSMSFVSRSFPSNHMFLSIRSSPLVRGKWSRFAGDGLAFRFVTCVVGGFLDMVTPPTASAIHPLVRGADPQQHAPDSTDAPVHPHVRGADASLFFSNSTSYPVHPHVRGADWPPR